ncbi:MAG: PAS domain S-box protein, partial [Pseudomonas sp.]|uniref:PAS domain-containing response regulator n=1 Tax=Pseudomonas sp. TaxID=306 RepID=UPI003BB5FCF4
MSVLDQPLRLLLIDDDEDDFLITQDLLRQGMAQAFVLDWRSDYQQALQAVLSQAHDLYLVDYRLGAESGLELIRHALQAGVRKPIILLTGQGDNQLDASAIELGAADYLVKGQFDSHQLARSIRYAIDRSQATVRLADSEARYRMLFEANPEPIWVFSKATMAFLAVNHAVTRFLGYAQSELLAMSVLDVRSAQEQERFLEYFDSTLGAAYISDLDAGIWTYLHKDGHEVCAEVLVHDFTFDNQPSFLVVGIDVTEKQKARLEAKRREHSFRKLLNDTRDAVLVVDNTGVVCYANPAAEKLFGT